MLGEMEDELFVRIVQDKQHCPLRCKCIFINCDNAYLPRPKSDVLTHHHQDQIGHFPEHIRSP